MSQIKFSFDRTSLKKIGKGALIALGSALVAYLANNMDGVAAAFKDSPLLASVVTAFAGIAINAAKEYLAGVDRQELDTPSSPEVTEIVQDLEQQIKEDVKKKKK